MENNQTRFSLYYTIGGKKVRISDHEPNFAMERIRGRNDIELYTNSADGQKLDTQGQIINLFDKGKLSKADLIEMYEKGIASRATLNELDISIPKKESALQIQYRIVDNWFNDIEGNQGLIADLAKNAERFVPYQLTTKQKEAWIKYVHKKLSEAGYSVKDDSTNFLSTPSGEVLGFVADGKIYLDPSKLNPETIAEEFTHLQQQALRLAAEQGNREARKIIRAWDNATKPLVKAFTGDRTSKATRDLLKAMGISESDMASNVYKKQPNESDESYRTRLQDELWANAQKKSFAEHLEKLANRNNLTAAGIKMYEALKDFAIYLGKQLGIYNQKEWRNLTLPELIDRTNKALSSDRFLRDTEHIRFQQRNQPTFKPISKRQFNQLARGLSRAFKKAERSRTND